MSNPGQAMRGAVFMLLTAGLWASACSSGAGAGNVDQDCYPNGTCNATLSCVGGKCVAGGHPTGTGGSTHETSSSTSTSSVGATTSSTSTSTSGTGVGGATTGTGGSTASATTSTGGPANGAPQILVFGTDVTSLTAGESVVFTAVVTDPDGIGDVIGGTLGDGNGNLYGAFATSSQEGAYALSVSWGEINHVLAINLAQGATTPRAFVADFFDQAGHTVEKTLMLTLGCKAIAACNGACIDLSQDANNCGACGQVCAGGVPCFNDHCAALTGCGTAYATCTQACAVVGKTCADKCGPGNNLGGISYASIVCGGAPTNLLCAASAVGASGMKCCCF